MATSNRKKVKSDDNLWTWMNYLTSSFNEDGYYESAVNQRQRFTQLTDEMCDRYSTEFVAKMAIYARHKIGLRTVPCLLAAILNSRNDFSRDDPSMKRRFFYHFPRRPDDVGQIFAFMKNDLDMGYLDKPSHAMVKGISLYLSGLNEYQLGKYKMANGEFNIYDLINLTHANGPKINKLKQGKLPSPVTWEVEISRLPDEEERNERWITLVAEHRLGYLALLRNLRNILTALTDKMEANDAIKFIERFVKPILLDEKAMSKNAFTFQIYNAYKIVSCTMLERGDAQRVVDVTLDLLKRALSLSVKAIKDSLTFGHSGCLVFDVSGSMTQPVSQRSTVSVLEASACIAESVIKTFPFVDIVKFASIAHPFNDTTHGENVWKDIVSLATNDGTLGYSTDLDQAINVMEDNERCRLYDTVFIFSDMQITSSTRIREYIKAHPRTTFVFYCLGAYDLSDTYDFESFKNCVNVTSIDDSALRLISLLSKGRTHSQDWLIRYIGDKVEI